MALLTSNSSFFEAALRSGFTEATSKIVVLPEDDPLIFEGLVCWLYCGQFTPEVHCNRDNGKGICARNLIFLWILADKLGCPKASELALAELMIAHRDGFISYDTVELAFTMSAPDSYLRRFVLSQYICDSTHDTWRKQAVVVHGWADSEQSKGDFSVELMRWITCTPVTRIVAYAPYDSMDEDKFLRMWEDLIYRKHTQDEY